MRPSTNVLAAVALGLLAVGVPAHAAAPPRQATPQQARKAAEKGLVFLQQDAEKWRKEKQCATCHRGVAIPKLLTDIMTETIAANGMTAAAAKYRELRKQYYGGQSYDFSDASLAGLAQRTNAAGTPDDAIALLQLNLEFNPQSARSYTLLGTIYAARNDNATAIKDFEKALEIDPNNAQAKQQLERLKK